MADFKDKVVFLNFWEVGVLLVEQNIRVFKIVRRQKDKVAFVLIAMQDEEEKVKKFLADNNYTTPVYFATSPLSEKMLPKVFPTTFILGQNGRILMKEDAAKDWNSESVHQFLIL